jgi:hypothetical protein
MLDGPGLRSRQGHEIFFSCPDRPHQFWDLPIVLFNEYTEVLSTWVKRQGRELDHSHPCSGDVMNEWSRTSTTTIFLSVVDRDKF